MTVYLHGLGHFHPENEVTNAFLEALDIGTTEAWVMDRVGIRSRRTTLPLDYIRATRNRDPRAAQEATLYTHAEAGRRAAEMALARAGLAAADVGMVIAGSSVMDTATPAEACNIARALGIEAPALDVNSACTSFFAHLHLVSLMRPEALPPFVLLVVSEAVTRARITTGMEELVSDGLRLGAHFASHQLLHRVAYRFILVHHAVDLPAYRHVDGQPLRHGTHCT